MKRMFRYNTGVIKQTSHIDDWATNDVRIMLQAIMTLAFVCFLLIDEVLTLQVHEIELLSSWGLTILLRVPGLDTVGDLSVGRAVRKFDISNSIQISSLLK